MPGDLFPFFGQNPPRPPSQLGGILSSHFRCIAQALYLFVQLAAFVHLRFHENQAGGTRHGRKVLNQGL